MDSAYEKVGIAMAPFGFEVTERPKISIEAREATTGRVGSKIHGPLGLTRWKKLTVEGPGGRRRYP
ncbi:MAG: hypothetical protein QOF85_765 [Solirubrobacterales bacterium]|jgi:hypothetical protein|nr:hypothetical protein [Solirubrobacterales bacterium]